MPNPDPAVVRANKHVLASVEEQISDLQSGLNKQVEIATIRAELGRLKTLVNASTLEVALKQSLEDAITITSDIQTGAKQFAEFGEVLVDLYSFQQSLQAGLDKQEITTLDKENFDSALLSVIKQVRQLLSYRPDVGTIMDDLTSVKKLRGGPADATAFHDFYVLQLAFKSVWMHAFDDNLANTVTQLYEETVKLYDEAGLIVPDFGALNDINELNVFITELKKTMDSTTAPPPPWQVTYWYPEAGASWKLLSDDQRTQIIEIANTRDELGPFATG
jgi:hypothetical protein